MRMFGSHKILMFFCFFFLFSQMSLGQAYIKGRLHGSSYQKVVVYKFERGAKIVDTLSLRNDEFVYEVPKGISKGVYRFEYFPKEHPFFTDVIYSGRDSLISFTIDDARNLKNRDFPCFENTKENKEWVRHKEQQQQLMLKIQSLIAFLSSYPNSKDKIVKQAESVYQKQKKIYDLNRIRFIEDNRGTWAALIEKNLPSLLPTRIHSTSDVEQEVKKVLSEVDVQNTDLLNTFVIEKVLLWSVAYYLKDKKLSSPKEYNFALKEVSDIIMGKFQEVADSGVSALHYLQKLFAQNDEVLQYVDERYQWLMEDQCTDDDEASEDLDYKKRLESYKKMKLGNKAPNIYLGSELPDLYHLEAERILVVFWASWCPHCMSELPMLVEWSAKHPDTGIVAISVDKNLQEYGNVVKEYPSMLHYCDGEGWKTKAAEDYYVKGTPTLFLLDSEKRIKGKYARVSQIKDANVR